MANIRTLSTPRKAEPFLALTQRAVFGTVGGGADPFDAWIRQVEQCATSKQKGDHFEELCVAYLLYPAGGGMVQAWTLSEMPEAVRLALGLPKRDFGIDIVAMDARGKFHAVQAKFKGRSNFRPSRYRRALRVTWTELSTFYALARRGPYETHWVMTTADGVSRAGGPASRTAACATGG